MAESSDQDKKRRASKRYSYTCDAECTIESQRYNIKILNVSTSGIQFASPSKLESKNEIQIRWRDLKFGGFSPTFLIAREIHNPQSKEFPFFYGVQYSNLTTVAKESLFKLLKFLKDESEKTIKQEVEKITPGYLFAVVDQGLFFIKSSLSSETKSPYFEIMLNEIKDYERAAFSSEADHSKHIQTLVLHNFHCHLFKSMVQVVAENFDVQLRFFQKVQTELQKIDEVIEAADVEIRKIQESELHADKKTELQRQLSESGNRLYYTIQGMLQAIVETFQPVVSELSEGKPIFEEIKEQYSLIAKSTNAGKQEATKYARRHKIPEEFSRVEAIVDIDMPVTNKKGRLFLLIFIFLVMAGIAGFVRLESQKKLELFSEKVNIEIEIKSFDRVDSQINIIISSADWKKMNDSKKKETFQKIADYLDSEKRISNAVLMDEKFNVIKVLGKGKKY
jgi:hypothetical protein